MCLQVQGDHLLLLTLYQLWAAAGFSKEFVRSYGLDLRGMNFAKEVRRQLAGVAVWGHAGWGVRRHRVLGLASTMRGTDGGGGQTQRACWGTEVSWVTATASHVQSMCSRDL